MLNVAASIGRFSQSSSTGAGGRKEATADTGRLLEALGRLDKERCVLVASESECEASAIGHLASILAPECVVLPLPLPTAGPVYSILMALEQSPMDAELLILEPGLPVDAPLQELLSKCRESGCDGCVAVHAELSTDLPCVVEDQGGISHVAWNRPAAGRRTAGFHWFRRTRQFVDAAEKAVLRHATAPGSLELGAAWNEALLAGAKVDAIPLGAARTHGPRTVEAPARNQETRLA